MLLSSASKLLLSVVTTPGPVRQAPVVEARQAAATAERLGERRGGRGRREVSGKISPVPEGGRARGRDEVRGAVEVAPRGGEEVQV